MGRLPRLKNSHFFPSSILKQVRDIFSYSLPIPLLIPSFIVKTCEESSLIHCYISISSEWTSSKQARECGSRKRRRRRDIRRIYWHCIYLCVGFNRKQQHLCRKEIISRKYVMLLLVMLSGWNGKIYWIAHDVEEKINF